MAHYGHTATFLCAGVQWDPQQQHFQRCKDPVTVLKKLGSSALILWHAGGNWGDVWRVVQKYRYVLLFFGFPFPILWSALFGHKHLWHLVVEACWNKLFLNGVAHVQHQMNKQYGVVF